MIYISLNTHDKLVKKYQQLLSCKLCSFGNEPEVIQRMIALYVYWQPNSSFKKHKNLKKQFEQLSQFYPEATRALLEEHSHELWDGEYVDANRLFYNECSEYVKLFKICNALPPVVDEAYVDRLILRTTKEGKPIMEHKQLSYLLHSIIQYIDGGKSRLKYHYPYVLKLLIPLECPIDD